MLRVIHLLRLGLICLCCLPLVALPIAGGSTNISLIDEFNGFGLTLTPFGNATISGPTISFPSSGGDIDETTLLRIYEHDNSGLEISNGSGSLQLKNPVVNTVTGRVFAMVWLNGASEGAPSVFVLQNDQSLSLAIPVIALASAAFGLEASALNGIVAASASIEANPLATTALPEPSTLLMMFTGTAMLWVGRRRLASEPPATLPGANSVASLATHVPPGIHAQNFSGHHASRIAQQE